MSEKPKSLFNKYWAANEKGIELAKEIDGVLIPIFDDYLKQGYSAMEIETVILGCLTPYAAEQRLRHAINLRKEEKVSNQKGES